MNNLIKARTKCEDEDRCFYSSEFLREPVEVFHPIIGFVTVNKKYINEIEQEIKEYENKHKDKAN